MKSPLGFTIDKAWTVEADTVHWRSKYSNRFCIVIRGSQFHSGRGVDSLCGYVSCSKQNPIFTGDIGSSVHGGITYRGHMRLSDRTLPLNCAGFDAAHHTDFRPGISMKRNYKHYRTVKYMMIQCEILANELDSAATMEDIDIPNFNIPEDEETD